uniref:Probable endo-1,4-beta-xylanase C n=2 Tax=Nicotiana TaxID=4085 RepID=A0A1S4B8Q7_TOBAC|nr:PREDICTED: probable endo-1,4-beta-xylanase C [Nicotiana tabacum]
MKTFKRNNNVLRHVVLLSCYFFFAGFQVYAIGYDYYFTSKCLERPLNPQYSGGIAINPELNNGLNGWTKFGSARIETRTSKEGNVFIVASHRTQPSDSFSQRFYVEKDKMYTISAWYNSRFKLTVFENEMKWWFTEPIQGKEDYHLADAMLQYVKNYSMLVRGHNIVWENKDQLPSWAKTLSPPLLSAAVERRFYSLVPRYQGQMMHWDVDNENIHFSYLESQLGENASAYFYKKAHDMDSNTILFLN